MGRKMTEKTGRLWRGAVAALSTGRLWLGVVIMLSTALLAWQIAFHKENFHVDELFSYAHANSTQGAFLSPRIDSFFHYCLLNRVTHAYRADRYQPYHILQRKPLGLNPQPPSKPQQTP